MVKIKNLWWKLNNNNYIWNAALVDTARKAEKGGNINVLDGIRGFAVVLVVIDHARAFGLDDIGRQGVYLFFVLSSFLLSTQFILKPERLTSFSAIATYLKRRILRIYPLFICVWIFLVLLRWESIQDMFANLLLVRGDGIYWAIQQEFIFYLILPAVMFITVKVLRNKAIPAVAFLVLLSIVSIFVFTEKVFGLQTINGVEGLAYRRFLLNIFLVGTIVAYLYYAPGLKKLLSNNLSAVVLNISGWLSLIALVFLSVDHVNGSILKTLLGDNYPFGDFAGIFISVLAAIIMLTALSLPQSYFGKLFSSYILRLLGTLSFSIYLTHNYIIKLLLDQQLLPFGKELFLATLVISFALSLFTYSLIERSFINRH